jgi:hypothetical protein
LLESGGGTGHGENSHRQSSKERGLRKGNHSRRYPQDSNQPSMAKPKSIGECDYDKEERLAKRDGSEAEANYRAIPLKQMFHVEQSTVSDSAPSR